jgi:hypothetical protein
MSKLAFTRFKNRGWLTTEELEHENELVKFIEEEENAKDVECDFVVSGMSDEQLKEVLEGARQRRKLKKKKEPEEEEEEEEEKQKILLT